MKDLALKAVGIKKTFNLAGQVVEVLKGIDFYVQKGSIFGIIGSSGSGKSTLLNILGCLDFATSGNYWIGDCQIERLNSSQLAAIRAQKIGFIFQRFNLLPDLTALDNVVVPQLYCSTPRFKAEARARELLGFVGLQAWQNHYPFQMSGGQQQRVAIARALANAPEIIFADEPTGSLDGQTGRLIIDLLKDLNQNQGATIVLVTHDPGIASQAHTIVQMADGRIIS